MMKKAIVMVFGTLVVVACGQTSPPSSPSLIPPVGSSTSGDAGNTVSTPYGSPLRSQGQRRAGFGFNGTVSGFPKGIVFLTGGGSYDRESNFVDAAGGFRCVDAVLQGPLSMSINPNDPGPCLTDQGIRWDTAALLDSTPFKCTASAREETAVTSDNTVVLQADFYRAGDGDDESFTAKMIVSDGDISSNFPGANIWVQGVGCGTAQTVNFNH
jgi:hypothetical protein